MGRKKWWSNREKEAGHEWVSEGLAADSGRREAPVLVSISPAWLLFPPPPLRIRRLLQAKRKISTDLSGLESLALPQGWNSQWENVCGSPDPEPGCQGGKLERQGGCLVFLGVSWDPPLCWVLWAWGWWGKSWMSVSMGWKHLGFGSGLG